MSLLGHRNLTNLFELFDVRNLGDGDLTAGANTLAAMALSIASCQRPGSAIVGGDGSRCAIGGGFLVSGSLSTSLVAEQVIALLAACQQGLSEQIRAWLDQERREQASATMTAREKEAAGPPGPPTHIGAELRNAAVKRQYESVRPSPTLTARPQESGVRELRDHPLVFATAGTPQNVLRLLEIGHLGRPLIHVALSDASDCQRYSRVCNRVLDGSVVHDTLPVPVRGELLVTDSGEWLKAAMRSGAADAGWLCRQPWLTDHGAPLELKPPGDRPGTAKLDRITERYEVALRQAWDRRLNFSTTAPERKDLDFGAAQAAWVAYLATCESQFPGITAAMRPLAASLLFGLCKIWTALPVAQQAMIDRDWILSFSAMLARRMVNARELMVHDEHRERMMRLAHSARRKLADGPQTTRALSRRFSRLSTAECEEVLDFLKEGGFVQQVGDRWSLTGQHGTTSPTPALTLNV
jgi:hypothetical protein